MSASKTNKSRPAKPIGSRGGCCECRRLHRKCDEQRPSCANCLDASKTCSYNRHLSLGGRQFIKSPFGKALAAGVVPLNTIEIGNSTSKEQEEVSGFVYTILQPTQSTFPDDDACAATSGAIPPDRFFVSSAPDPLLLKPEWLSWMPEEQRALVDHFMRNLIPCFSLHPVQPGNFCSSFLPLALDTTHGAPLLAAISMAALVHRDTLNSPKSNMRFAILYQKCIHHLRGNKVGKNVEVDDVYVATALILCLTEILAGGKNLRA